MEEKLLPKHIAIIMDGNRRWAKEKGLDYRLGHKEGAETLRKIAKYANKLGVKYLTVYAFSTENWKRTKEEVGALMILLQKYLEEFLSSDDFENIKVNMLGNIADLDTGLQKSINKIIEKTKNNTGLVLNIAFNYGGRDEITRAVRKIAGKVSEGSLKPEDIDEDTISNNLDTWELPDPDLLIRTSGEQRLSNYLCWQLAYTEFYFTDIYWPDFDREELIKAFEKYNKTERRFGGVKEE